MLSSLVFSKYIYKFYLSPITAPTDKYQIRSVTMPLLRLQRRSLHHGCFTRGVWSPGRVCRGSTSRAAIYVLGALCKQCWIVIYYSNYHLRDCASHHAAMLRAAHERHLVLTEAATQCECACPLSSV